MGTLPSGTVTFVFTDIEGSTRLLHALGEDAYAQALAEHRRVVRRAFDDHGGVEVDTQGDAFFYAFPTAPGALGGARDAQQALSDSPMRVRIARHAALVAEGYVGEDVRAARIAACGHAGRSRSASMPLSPGAISSNSASPPQGPPLRNQLGPGDFPPLPARTEPSSPPRRRRSGQLRSCASTSATGTCTGPIRERLEQRLPRSPAAPATPERPTRDSTTSRTKRSLSRRSLDKSLVRRGR